MPSRFISASHDSMNPASQAQSHEGDINPFASMGHDSPYSPNGPDHSHMWGMNNQAADDSRNSSVQEGRSVSQDDPSNYAHLISYYFSSPTSSFKSLDEPVHRSIW